MNTLLHGDVCSALQRVDDRAVLLVVVHREACKVDPSSSLVWQAPPLLVHLRQDLRALGVVGDLGRPGPGQHQLGAVVEGNVIGKSGQDPDGILQAVPPRDLDHDRRARVER